MVVGLLVFMQLILQLSSPSTSSTQTEYSEACVRRCGEVEIPYPFGTTESCSLDSNFLIQCNNSTSSDSPVPETGNVDVNSISVQHHEMSIFFYVSRDCPQESYNCGRCSSSSWRNITATILGDNSVTLMVSPIFRISPTKNKFTVIGCDSYAYLNGYQNNAELPLVLDWAVNNETCVKNGSDHQDQPFCRWGKIADAGTWRMPLHIIAYAMMVSKETPICPMVAKVHIIYINECENPSLNNCTRQEDCVNTEGSYTCLLHKGSDRFVMIKITIGVAIGFIALLISSSWMHLVLKQRKLMKLKEKFFQQNGGLVLLQKLSRQEDSNEMVKIFTEEELNMATLNFNESRIIGQGGFGTVYKGILTNKRTVAIKRSKIIDQSQIEQFINEVVVLSQINHRNVVKLIGCCLETQVPLLVYEFVPNGTLFEHIHDHNKASNLLWENRLSIAAEAAGALSYLHSAASTPIIHRDVKSSNILLDNYMTAKVSDFGASRLVPLDQTELATIVQGTLGYLDPEYLHTNQLTEKSDVYSFGVVLVELLTGQKALSFERSEKERSLAMHFLYSLREDRLFEIVESRIVNEGNRELLKEVAEIARGCLNLKGDDRPTMKEVAMELEGLRKTEKHMWAAELNLEETECLLGEIPNAYKESGHSQSTTSTAITLDFSGR
ncbi:hypothetical protein FNV43_RR07134 [Rhamnella rubrinervis]|uniref:Protein kinase domain-containing protein n=1 Tax=Rhamnella rubrinervis TaxID=2594499 RepID=A0A8K0HES5_9ROSA|nr:hypothetical protein FNV43_RR07134 [Rhamnella rubrinervis]